MRRLGISLVATALLVGSLAAPAAAGTARMIGGISVAGPHADALCADLVPFSDYGPLMTGFGSVSLIAGDTLVGGTMMLHGARPNTAYQVRLIQGRPDWWNSDCHDIDGSVQTDAAGNASFTLREPRDPAATVISIFINDETYSSAFIGKVPLAMTPLISVGPLATGASAPGSSRTVRR